MNVHKFVSLTQLLGINKFTCHRFLSKTPLGNFNQNWREEQGLPFNPNAYGPLTDKPDYSFLDGRPTPYGTRQRRRIVKQREIAHQIIALTKEVDFAVERYAKMKVEEEERKQSIIDSKLKAKGILLLKQK